MENANAITYTPAKNKAGCTDPTGAIDLVFILIGFSFLDIGVLGGLNPVLSRIGSIKIFHIIVVCKSTSTL